ncbi:hypothetical protein [Roseimaritima ulvae]|uniref:Uncharacterized protein n=1 Tax=Roseimaritima ulvae TaxID=980254 RepID=A0A5B9QSF1_9BACT|nr:hypothetical protein [Roseimaritima ulvae]QEG41988.1 hypothetical protein UC8_40170 [Roseimaritima ulvae]
MQDNRMMRKATLAATIVLSLWAALVDGPAVAGNPRSSQVSPLLEIEVLDPGVDARGNPAVVLNDVGSGTVVDIPPTVLVHRYYFTGERSFRGPNLPGGPSIVVANHPRTGERVYVSVQLLPGSPMVHYHSNRIEYDYGDTGISVVFPCLGEPRTKIRSGRKLSTRVNNLLHLDEIKSAQEDKVKPRVGPIKRVSIAAEGLLLSAKDVVQPLTQPAEHALRLIPGVVALTDPNTEIENARRVREHNLEYEREKLKHRTLLDDLDRATIR